MTCWHRSIVDTRSHSIERARPFEATGRERPRSFDHGSLDSDAFAASVFHSDTCLTTTVFFQYPAPA
jgi:hypothetical protein